MDNIETVRNDLVGSAIHLCPERAYLLTDFFKNHDDPGEPMAIRKARALHYLLSKKEVKIYPGELIVGNAGTYRKSCILQPELASVFMSQELMWIDRRKTNPLRATLKDKLKLGAWVIPYWLRHSMPIRMFPNLSRAVSYMKHQLKPTFYLINEAGGIGHFLPDYEKMLLLGTRGFLGAIEGKDGALYKAASIACEALEIWAERFAEEAGRLGLEEIAGICRKVPRNPAESFHEALQSLWLTHLAINLESLNSAVSFGRIDQYLYPYYKSDIDSGRLTSGKALELLLLFSAKATEHVFLLNKVISEYYGGYLVAQAAIVGGIDAEDKDMTNPLTYLFFDVMERHQMREPNYQARVHRNSPPEFLSRALEVARQGHGVPALFNDEAVVPALIAHGLPLEVARNYGMVGCVEPSIPGKSFFSTDAGLVNLPICMELALNMGRRFGSNRCDGVQTPDPRSFKSIDNVIDAFRVQLDYTVDRMIDDFHMVEKGNRDYSPTPLSSMLVKGCLESGQDLTEGGAVYNSSGIQGVGVADVADSLAALDVLLFKEKRLKLSEVMEALYSDFEGREAIRLQLERAPKFGNDQEPANTYADLVVHMYHDSLTRHKNTRGGPYVPGFYSVTCHVAFGSLTGALPSGRKAGEPFASSIGPATGADRSGPTALLNSVASLDSSLMANGNALNLRFDPADISGEKGIEILSGLVQGFFEKGGMEVQFNVLDPETLDDARAHPGKYPELVVRVAGYCAYFDDLPDSAKAEIINRTRLKV